MCQKKFIPTYFTIGIRLVMPKPALLVQFISIHIIYVSNKFVWVAVTAFLKIQSTNLWKIQDPSSRQTRQTVDNDLPVLPPATFLCPGVDPLANLRGRCMDCSCHGFVLAEYGERPRTGDTLEEVACRRCSCSCVRHFIIGAFAEY